MTRKKRPSAGLTKSDKSKIVKKARSGHKFGKKTTFKDIERKAYKKYGSKKKAKAVAGSVFWKTQARKKVNYKKTGER